MTISRLTSDIRPEAGDRFILFYGKVNDEFCDDDLIFGNIELCCGDTFRNGITGALYFSTAQKKSTFLMRHPGGFACRISSLLGLPGLNRLRNLLR
jgi:hypothetical protein